jgi:hypothetical protein
LAWNLLRIERVTTAADCNLFVRAVYFADSTGCACSDESNRSEPNYNLVLAPDSPKRGTAHNVGALELAIGWRRASVNRIIWIIGAIVVVLAILSFLGLR